MKKSCDIQ